MHAALTLFVERGFDADDAIEVAVHRARRALAVAQRLQAARPDMDAETASALGWAYSDRPTAEAVESALATLD